MDAIALLFAEAGNLSPYDINDIVNCTRIHKVLQIQEMNKSFIDPIKSSQGRQICLAKKRSQIRFSMPLNIIQLLLSNSASLKEMN